jgi:large-conductance mechanosensitive channel
MEDKKEFYNKGMLKGALIGVAIGVALGAIVGGKEKIIMLGAIGLIAGGGIGYGGKKFVMSSADGDGEFRTGNYEKAWDADGKTVQCVDSRLTPPKCDGSLRNIGK